MIATFYSYKGGVGRSMALMNVAEILTEAGYRVLICDFDLEAPGLERYACNSQREAKALEPREGVIDLLTGYKDSLAAPGSPDGSLPELQSPLSVAIPLPRQTGGAGWLRLLTAGKRDNTDRPYARLVQDFDWTDFYERWAGGSYLEFFRRSLDRFADPAHSPDRADIVLIDSRTGVTEHGGVCTHHLADLVVLFSAANDLNVTGTEWMAEKLARPDLARLRDGRELRMLPVAARIEQLAEKEELVTFRSRFAETFGPRLPSAQRSNRFFAQTEIPYVPFYSFVERVVARENPERRHRELYSAYTQLAYAIVREGMDLGVLDVPPVAAWLPPIEPASDAAAAFPFPRILIAHENWLKSGGTEGERANLSGRDLTNQDLSRRNLRQADLRGVKLERADLTECDLTDANLDHAVLDRAILKGAKLKRARLTGASLKFADLTLADLTDCDLTDAFLGQAVLRDVDLGSTLGLTRKQIAAADTNQNTKLPYRLVEEVKSRSEQTPVKTRYQAFICHHHADESIAASLQHALERFGRPWYSRPAKLFREGKFSGDLQAEVLSKASRASEFLILLVSPMAAESAWIKREVQDWLDRKGPDNIILVKVSGEITWDSASGDFAVSSAAIPPLLRGVFPNEPLWIDLSWVQSQDQLSLAYPRFQDAVAVIAAALAQTPKSELIGQEIRKQRQLRIAFGLVTAFSLIFAIFCLGLAFVIGGQRDESARETQSLKTQNQELQRDLSRLRMENETLLRALKR